MSTVIATSGGRRNTLVFSMGEFEGRRVFDIRKCYVSSETGELVNTTKGITLAQKNFEVLCNVLSQYHDKISSWFAETDGTEGSVRRDHAAQEQAAIVAVTRPQPYRVETRAWKSAEFFEVHGEGGTDCLVWNSRHPFVKSLLGTRSGTRPAPETQLVRLLECAIVSFARAKRVVGDGPAADVGSVVEMLESNWGIALERYTEESTRAAG